MSEEAKRASFECHKILLSVSRYLGGGMDMFRNDVGIECLAAGFQIKIQEAIDAEVCKKYDIQKCVQCGGYASTYDGVCNGCLTANEVESDNKIMADCLTSMKDAGFSYGIEVNAAIERVRTK